MANAQGRPWLGIRARTIDNEIRAAMELPMTRGVCVMGVFSGGPGRAAGLRSGDVIIRVNGRSVKDDAMLENFVMAKKPGDEIKLTICRGRQKMDIRATLWGSQAPGGPGPSDLAVLQAQPVAAVGPAVQPLDPETLNPPGLTGILNGAEVGAGEIEALGMGVEELVPELALAFGIPETKKGLVLTEVAAVAQAAGLLPGDVLEKVNTRPTKTIVDFMKAMQTADLDKGIALEVYRQGSRFNLVMKS
jgi:serine protease Do